jgi:archaellum component FlaF (FlaF/FlaG flagellin family)
MNIYKKNNILISGLLSSTYNFISKTYSQSNNLFTVASAWGQVIFVFQNISQLILYFIEDSITELNIEQATRDYSVRSLARISGYDPKRSTSSQGEVNVAWNSSNVQAGGGSVIISKNTQIRNQQNGQIYSLILPSDTVTIPLSSQSQPQNFKVVQGTFISTTFTSSGASLSSFNIPALNGPNIDQFYVNVYVNEEKWRRYDSFYDIPLQAKGFIVKSGITSGIDIYFGNSFFGQIPQAGARIRVEYLNNIGIKGNVYSTQNNPLTWKFVSSGTDLYGASLDLNQYLNIVNSIDPDFGTDPDATSLIRIVAPKTSRAFVFANAQSYEIFLNKLGIFSQIQAYSTFEDNYLDDDNVVYLYLVPDVTLNIASNQDYFSVPIQNFILSASQKARIMNLIEDSGSMIATTVVQIVSPDIRRFVLNINITIFQGFDPSTIKQQIRNKISEYMLNLKRRDKIPRSDMVAIIESVSGVDSVYVEFISQADQDSLRQLQDSSATDQTVNYQSSSIDSFGDIIIGLNQLVLLRGGFQDIDGNLYTVSPVTGQLGPINISIQGLPVLVNFNSQLNATTRQSIINK